MNKEIIYEDDNMVLVKDDKFLISTLKNLPKGIWDFDVRSYHIDMSDFNEFKNRFESVYKLLKEKTELAYFIMCKRIKYIEAISCKIDVRYSLTNEQASDIIMKHFEEGKKEAIVEIESLILKGENVNAWDEQKIDDLCKDFCLEKEYGQYMGSPNHEKKMDNLLEKTNELLEMIKKENKKTKSV